MKTKWLIFTVLITFLLLVAAPVLAKPFHPQQDVAAGKPTQFRPGLDAGYYIWHDGNTWHLGTTTRGRERHFHGVIRTNGEISAVRSDQAEWRQDRVRADYRRDNISFDFRTGRSTDGLSFKLTNQTYIQFDLYIDGRYANTALVHVGHSNWHPARVPFSLEFHKPKPVMRHPSQTNDDPQNGP